MIDEDWVAQALRSHTTRPDVTGSVVLLEGMLRHWAKGFAEGRDDVLGSELATPRRGLLSDEAASFLRALDAEVAHVDHAGYVTLPTVRPKRPPGRYALFSKLGLGVGLNLEYLIQVGAAAELILDHGWPADSLDFERGEFDTLASDPQGRVCLAVEAKARVSGGDSLEGLLRFWLRASQHPDADLNNNAGRKLRELHRLCAPGPVHVWLVADSARWPFVATIKEGRLDLETGVAPGWALICNHRSLEAGMNPSHPYDATYHRPGSVAAQGRCSQHGLTSCEEPPVVSFQDRHDRWQSGCARALAELTARGEIASIVALDG